MAFGAFVQSAGNRTTTTTTSVKAFTSDNTAGNSIQVAVLLYNATTGRTITVTDTKSNTYTEDAAVTDTTINPIQLHVFSAHSIPAGANTVTATCSGANVTALSIVIFEHEGDMTLDKTANAKNTVGTDLHPNSGATATTTANDELVFGCCGAEGQTFGITAGTGFGNARVDDTTFGTQYLAGEDMVVSTTGAQTATLEFNVAQGRAWICIVTTYKAPAAAAALSVIANN